MEDTRQKLTLDHASLSAYLLAESVKRSFRFAPVVEFIAEDISIRLALNVILFSSIAGGRSSGDHPSTCHASVAPSAARWDE
jgi:hypothetical protein